MRKGLNIVIHGLRQGIYNITIETLSELLVGKVSNANLGNFSKHLEVSSSE